MATHPIHIEYDQSDFDRHVESAMRLLEEGNTNAEEALGGSGSDASHQEGEAHPSSDAGTHEEAQRSSLA